MRARRSQRLHLLILALLALATGGGNRLWAETTPPPTRAEWTAKLRPLALNRTVQADFVQTRHLRALDFTLTIRGRMAQEQGQRLAWITETPIRSVALFSHDAFRQWDGETGKVITVTAANMPWLRLIFTCQSHWLSGNLEALDADFAIASADAQTLRLTPRRDEFKLFFNSLEIRFTPAGDAVDRLLFLESQGDSMQIDFSQVRNNAPIPEHTWILPPP